MRLLSRLFRDGVYLLTFDYERVVARAEAQGTAEISKADEDGTKAMTALCRRPEAGYAIG